MTMNHVNIILDSLRGSSVNIRTTQIILARPLRKHDTRTSRSENISYKSRTPIQGRP